MIRFQFYVKEILHDLIVGEHSIKQIFYPLMLIGLIALTICFTVFVTMVDDDRSEYDFLKKIEFEDSIV